MKKIFSCIAIALACVFAIPFAFVGCKKTKNTRTTLAGVYSFYDLDFDVKEKTAFEAGEDEVAVPTADDTQEMIDTLTDTIKTIFEDAKITLHLDGKVETNMFELLLDSEDVLPLLASVYGEQIPEGYTTLGDMLEELGIAQVTYEYRWVPFKTYAVFYGQVNLLDADGHPFEVPDNSNSEMAIFFKFLPYVTNALQYINIEEKQFDYEYNTDLDNVHLFVYFMFKRTANAPKRNAKAVSNPKGMIGNYTIEKGNIKVTIQNEDELIEAMGGTDEETAEIMRNMIASIGDAASELLEDLYFELTNKNTVKTNLFDIVIALLNEDLGEIDQEPEDYIITRDMLLYYIQQIAGEYVEEFNIASIDYDYNWTPDINNIAVLFGTINPLDATGHSIIDSMDKSGALYIQLGLAAIPGFFRTVTAKNGEIALNYYLEYPMSESFTAEISIDITLKK